MAKAKKQDLSATKQKIQEEAEDLIEEIEEVEEEEAEGFSLESFVQKYQYPLIGLGVAIVLVVGGLVFYNSQQASRNVEANNEMFRAIQYFEADSFSYALNGDNTNRGFLEIEDEYSGTPAANLAKYYIGLIYLSQDTADLDQGISYLESFDKPANSTLTMAAYVALGYAYEDIGDPSAAADYFERAISAVGSDNEQAVPALLMNVGRNFEAAGDNSRALDAYERIQDDFPLSSEGTQIEKYIARVSQ